jgi:3-dehydroquinate dehydratase-1
VGNRPMVCVPVIDDDPAAIKKAASLADLFEVRIDLIGKGWCEVAGHLDRPWLACNRRVEEGGKWRGSEMERIGELLESVEQGASIVDIELATPGLAAAVKKIKGKAECLISYHNIEKTPPLKELKEIIKRQVAAGADICKVVTTARTLTDNVTILQLIKEFPGTKVVAFAMGEVGYVSRVLCPLAGGYFTYAAIAGGKESAAGQIAVVDLRKIYEMV